MRPTLKNCVNPVMVIVATRSPVATDRRYRRVKTFDVTRYVMSYQGLPGMGYLLADAVFYVYKRADDEPLRDTPR